MELKEEEREGVTLLRLSGHLDLFTAKTLRQKVQELLQGGRRRIILDFVEVSYIDSSGVGALLHVYSQARHGAFEIRFVNLQRPVAHVIALTKLTDYFPLSESVEEAEAELRSP
jgi:anti-sigma B factor antagonist